MINTPIDFDDAADLKADNGILTVNGLIIDVNVLGTADADGTLNIPTAWNTGTASRLVANARRRNPRRHDHQ